MRSIEPKKALSETIELNEEDVDGRERGDLGAGRAGRRGKTAIARSAANTAVYPCRVAALGAGEEERGRGPLLLRHGVVIRGGGEGVVDGAEGPGSLDELDELVVASLQPLQTMGASKSGAKGEERAGRVEVEDGGSRGEDGGGGGGGEIVGGSGGNQGRKGRAELGGTVTCGSGGDTKRGERISKQGRGGRETREGKKIGPDRTGSVCTGSVRTGSVRTGSIRTGSVRTGSIRTGSFRTGSFRTGSVRTGSVRTGSVRTGSVRTGLVRYGPDGTGAVRNGPY